MASQDSSQFTETEPISDFESASELLTQSEPEYWGRLYPLKSSLQAIDLTKDKYTFGLSPDADVTFNQEKIPQEVSRRCSKEHFIIERQQINVMGALTTRVALINTGRNGTFINQHVLNKKANGISKRKILSTNDVIGLPGLKPCPIYEVYVFIDALMRPSSTIPISVRSKYEVSVRLGAGTFGEVSLVFHKMSKRPFAMKTVVTDMYATGATVNSCKKKLLNELNILQTVNHPNVISLVDVVHCKKEHFLILEYMEGKDLANKIQESQRLKENTAKLYFYQICRGVEYLHSIGIIHRDLKPPNILLASSKDETLIKLTDFGLSKVLSSSSAMMKTLCGTKTYVAPEIILGGGSFEYTKQVDIWSLGVILYVCLSGIEPFSSEPENILELITEAIYSSPSKVWDPISIEVKSLIKGMLTQDPYERIKISDILSDKWFQGDFEMLARVNTLCNSSEDLSETFTTSSFNSSMEYHSTLECTLDCTLSPPKKKFRNE